MAPTGERQSRGGSRSKPWVVVSGRWGDARRRAQNRSTGWRVGVPVVCVCAGLLATTSMINARGTDLRGGRHTDLIGLVSEQRGDVERLQRTLHGLQSNVQTLTQQVDSTQLDELEQRIRSLSPAAGLTSMTGPGLAVALDDAPLDQSDTADFDPNLLVVHQGDIQAVVNALWDGGAQGISLQNQRIVSTTGIKCVGNTVVLQGVPYSPPYRVRAVGDSTRMYAALQASEQVQAYLDYTAAPYNLGWSLRADPRVTLPSYAGPLTMQYATPEQ